MILLLYPLLFFVCLTSQVIVGRPQMPHLLLIATAFVSLYRGSLSGEIFGYLAGLGLDSFSPTGFGSQALGLALVGFIFGWLPRRIHEGNPINQLGMLLVAFLGVVGLTWLQSLLFGWSFSPGRLSGLLVAASTTALAAPPLCLLLNRIFQRFVPHWEVTRRSVSPAR